MASPQLLLNGMFYFKAKLDQEKEKCKSTSVTATLKIPSSGKRSSRYIISLLYSVSLYFLLIGR